MLLILVYTIQTHLAIVASATIALIDQYLAVNGSVNKQSMYVQDNSVYVQDNVAVLLSRTAIKQNPSTSESQFMHVVFANQT